MPDPNLTAAVVALVRQVGELNKLLDQLLTVIDEAVKRTE